MSREQFDAAVEVAMRSIPSEQLFAVVGSHSQFASVAFEDGLIWIECYEEPVIRRRTMAWLTELRDVEAPHRLLRSSSFIAIIPLANGKTITTRVVFDSMESILGPPWSAPLNPRPRIFCTTLIKLRSVSPDHSLVL